jgi:4a-hydroxytetrahydrobiopterin dehydratase
MQVYNTTFVRWTTHHPPGLSVLDVNMAAFCDSAAAENGEVLPEKTEEAEEAAQACALDVDKSLLDRVVEGAGDCCVPKSARVEK